MVITLLNYFHFFFFGVNQILYAVFSSQETLLLHSSGIVFQSLLCMHMPLSSLIFIFVVSRYIPYSWQTSSILLEKSYLKNEIK